mmetsp:Transcript_52355/g.150058  ORF Transcript_52355/g.150058 Transcript_52355/m.150058 type:complete len:267 (-) Transcript_52355:758-1558(-)
MQTRQGRLVATVQKLSPSNSVFCLIAGPTLPGPPRPLLATSRAHARPRCRWGPKASSSTPARQSRTLQRAAEVPRTGRSAPGKPANSSPPACGSSSQALCAHCRRPPPACCRGSLLQLGYRPGLSQRTSPTPQKPPRHRPPRLSCPRSPRTHKTPRRCGGWPWLTPPTLANPQQNRRGRHVANTQPTSPPTTATMTDNRPEQPHQKWTTKLGRASSPGRRCRQVAANAPTAEQSRPTPQVWHAPGSAAKRHAPPKPAVVLSHHKPA